MKSQAILPRSWVLVDDFGYRYYLVVFTNGTNNAISRAGQKDDSFNFAYFLISQKKKKLEHISSNKLVVVYFVSIQTHFMQTKQFQ